MRPSSSLRAVRIAVGAGLGAVLSCACLAQPGATPARPDAAVTRPDAAFGQCLDATRGSAQVAANALYETPPLAFECWAKLDNRDRYNIIVAQEDKPSATHWELFTTPGDGIFHVYVPGRTPNHAHTQTVIADGQWHYLAMVMEATRIRLYVDGAEAANVVATAPAQKGAPGPLVFGALVAGDLTCSGQIDEARLSKCVREIRDVPTGEFAPDADTIGLWHFNQLEDGKYKDASSVHGDAVYKKDTTTTLVGQQKVPGGMPTEYQPLPPGEDVAPMRAALKAVAERLKLTTVRAGEVRDAVFREWSYDYQWWGKLEYPKSREVTWQDKQAVRNEVFDQQALIWDSDGGPLGTVLRRTQALAECLERAGAQIGPARADLARLKADVEAGKPQVDSEAYRGAYFAACALRRQIALSNPLLDFDAMLCVARGTFEGSARSNPQTQDYQGGHFVTQYFGFNALPGGGLFIVRNYKGTPQVTNILANSVVQNGRLKGTKLDHGAFSTPALSFDGKTIAFAWTENSEHKWVYGRKTCWHIFRVNVDGTDLRQLTNGAYDDFDPCWLPDGRIAFSSERRGGHIRCFAAYLKVRTYTLFSMKDDGSEISPLSYYETSEWNPTVNNDGQLVYTRWDYTDRENCIGSRIWVSNPDGTNPRAPHGNYPLPYDTFADHKAWKRWPDGREMDSRFGAPLVEMGIRAIPGSHRYICTAAPHHGEVYGSLCVLDLRTEDDDHMSQVRRITPDEPFPESEMPNRRHYKYGTPWPLSEDFYLCNSWENLVLLDRFGNKELLCELPALPCKADERLRVIDPIPLRARPTPPVILPNTRQGNPSAPPATPANAPATIAVQNVYDSDLPFPKGTKIKWLRVVQNILKENHAMGEPMIGYERENTPRIPLGIVPVEEDGSAYFEAPVAKELIFQALDEDFRAVQSMRSVAFVHPGERLSCLGCHENPRKAPAARRVTLASQRPPSQLTPEIGPIEPISYYRQIRPIFEGQCVKCHIAEGKGPKDMSYEALREDAFWFSGAMLGDMTTAYSGIHGGSRTIPGRFGARNCKLGKALMDETHLKAVSLEDRHKVIVWLDCNSLRLGAYYREEAQLRGELVWPTLDVDPENVLGVEGRGKPLRGNFWHEQLYGPHAFLCSDHVHDKVFIIDESGKGRWEYSVPHPQDLWMLPNGNILTTYYQGVREVTRDKQIVWEYKTEKPNEIPNCQPLPDGNVMIGIVGECRLIEVNRKGEIVHQVQLSTPVKEPHAQFRMCRKTPEGTYLVPFTAEGAVREYDRDGKVIRTFPSGASPVCALRLEDGHTLIGSGGMVTEFDRGGSVVWQLSEVDIPDISIATIAGIQRLPNGDTVVCNWNTRDTADKIGAHIFEVTMDKRVVWQVTGDTVGQVAQCQLLTGELKARGDGTVR